MMNPILFTANIIFVCAMLTFLPSIAFALANSYGGGRSAFPTFTKVNIL